MNMKDLDASTKHVLVEKATGIVHGYGYTKIQTNNPDFEWIDIRSDQASKLDELGMKTINEDGTITVTVVPLDPIVVSDTTPTEQQLAIDDIVKQGIGALSSIDVKTSEGRALVKVFSAVLDDFGQKLGSRSVSVSDAERKKLA